MNVEITWERNDEPVWSPAAGWRACVGPTYVGSVYFDGEAWFGRNDARRRHIYGSQALAAQALVFYVRAGGR